MKKQVWKHFPLHGGGQQGFKCDRMIENRVPALLIDN